MSQNSYQLPPRRTLFDAISGLLDHRLRTGESGYIPMVPLLTVFEQQ
jgi:hypothetical protein